MASLIRWLFFSQSLNMLTHMLHFHSLDRLEVGYWEILCHLLHVFFSPPENVTADVHILLHSEGGVRATTENVYISPYLLLLARSE